MKKKLIGACASLVLGVILTAYGYLGGGAGFMSADTGVPEGVVQTVEIALIVGVVLIIISLVLFTIVIAGAGENKIE